MRYKKALQEDMEAHRIFESGEPEYHYFKGQGWAVYRGPRKVVGKDIKPGDKVVGWRYRNAKVDDKPGRTYLITRITDRFIYHKSEYLDENAIFHEVYKNPESDPIEYFVVE